jgi:hypothetical protein
MATNLTSIFGEEITVHARPSVPQRQFAGFPGADGLVSMHLGMRGREIVITGRLRVSGNTYQIARQNMQDEIDAIQAYCGIDTEATNYSYMGETYNDVVFGPLQLIPDGNGKVFHYTAEKKMIVNFMIILVSQK